ncbi:MAG: rare lipoprotein [Solirubrobacteraceae bacterium]|nr:rare lipoprotein [Solirubrobacteraceae bacterium]
MRPSPLRRGIFAAASCMIMIGAGAVPALAPADTQGTPTASIAKVGVSVKRLNIRAGRRVVVIGSVAPATKGLIASLQVKHGSRWFTIARDRTSATGRYVLRSRRAAPMSAPVRVHVRAHGARVQRRVGRLNVYRWAQASWYGPGFYGRRTGCGGTLGYSQLGVANKSLPCGTKVTLRHRGHVVRVPVIDRGPYSGAREYDLTAATARKLGFHGHGDIQTTR